MIGELWASLVSIMTSLGFLLDPSETDQLSDRRYTIILPMAERDDTASTVGCTRVIRDMRLRLQYKERKDIFQQKTIAEDVERVVTALRSSIFVFESARVEDRQGGYIAEIQLSARDRWAGTET